eukprot:5898500-Pyramimonas_sp.AAC.1
MHLCDITHDASPGAAKCTARCALATRATACGLISSSASAGNAVAGARHTAPRTGKPARRRAICRAEARSAHIITAVNRRCFASALKILAACEAVPAHLHMVPPV